jgi:hypothetical protein
MAAASSGCSTSIIGDWTADTGATDSGDILRILEDGTGRRETFRPFRGGELAAVYDIDWRAGGTGFELVLTCSDASFELTGHTYRGCNEVEAFLNTGLDEQERWICNYERSVDRLECLVDGSRRNYYAF